MARLTEHGHEAIAAAPATGVDTLTGEGVEDALEGASVVVDVSSSPSFEDAAALEFFTTSTRNLLAAEGPRASGTTWRCRSSEPTGCPRAATSAKNAQERLITTSQIPYSIVRATQFFEFAEGIAEAATVGATVRVAPALVQPIAADDVAGALGRLAVDLPVKGIVEVARPEQFRLDVFIRRWLDARRDRREVVADQSCRYFDALLGERTLLPGFEPTMGETRFARWLGRSAPAEQPIGRLVAEPVRA